MKKILLYLLLACSISTFAQAEFPEGIKLGGNASTVNSTKLLNQNPTTGTLDHINATSLPVSTATQTALNLKANIANPTFTGTVSGITKSMVGLGNVDNTSDLNKPISTATQTALNGKEPIIPTGTAVQYIKGDKTLGTFPTVPTVDQSIIDGSTNAVSGNAVFDGLAGKADDDAVVKLTGDQLITGQKTFTNSSSGNSILLNNTSSGSGIYSNNTSSGSGIYSNNTSSGSGIYSNNTSRGFGILLHNSSTGFGILLNNTSSGSGIYSNNTSSGSGIYSNNSSTGNGIISNQTVTGTGLNYVGQNNGTNTFTVDKFGATTATSFIKSGGLSSQFLKADGSIDSNSYALASSTHNPVTIGTANGLSLSTQQLSLGLASSGVTGALSGTDWNTFNGKFNTPTGLTTNYLPKWNGSGFVNSSFFDDGTTNAFISNGIYSHFTIKGIGTSTNGGGQINFSNESILFSTITGEATSIDNGMTIFRNARNGTLTDVFRTLANGNTLFGKTNDAGDGLVQVNGNITASPAVSPNQVVVKSQLDAVAGTSGSYTPTITGATNITINTPTVKGNYIKIGNIVSVQVNIEGTPTANQAVSFGCTVPFNRVGSGVFYMGGASVFDSGATSNIIGSIRMTNGVSSAVSVIYRSGSATNPHYISLNFQYDITQ